MSWSLSFSQTIIVFSDSLLESGPWGLPEFAMVICRRWLNSFNRLFKSKDVLVFPCGLFWWWDIIFKISSFKNSFYRQSWLRMPSLESRLLRLLTADSPLLLESGDSFSAFSLCNDSIAIFNWVFSMMSLLPYAYLVKLMFSWVCSPFIALLLTLISF